MSTHGSRLLALVVLVLSSMMGLGEAGQVSYQVFSQLPTGQETGLTEGLDGGFYACVGGDANLGRDLPFGIAA